jgi:hypothetical protein
MRQVRITFVDGSSDYFSLEEAATVRVLQGPMIAAVTKAHRTESVDRNVELPALGRIVNRFGKVVA